MKFFTLLLIGIISINTYSHCGGCGVGDSNKSESHNHSNNSSEYSDCSKKKVNCSSCDSPKALQMTISDEYQEEINEIMDDYYKDLEKLNRKYKKKLRKYN